jgi:hypothetical protein
MGMACRFNSSSMVGGRDLPPVPAPPKHGCAVTSLTPLRLEAPQVHPVRAGHTHADEMCNEYLMVYSQLPTFMWCLDGRPWLEVRAPVGCLLSPTICTAFACML